MIANESEKICSDATSNEQSFEWDGEDTVPVAVVNAVATVTGEEVTEMEPLSAAVDTDSLDDLFEPTRSTPRKHGLVEFEYSGCLVRVSADGEIVVRLPGDR